MGLMNYKQGASHSSRCQRSTRRQLNIKIASIRNFNENTEKSHSLCGPFQFEGDKRNHFGTNLPPDNTRQIKGGNFGSYELNTLRNELGCLALGKVPLFPELPCTLSFTGGAFHYRETQTEGGSFGAI